MTGIISPGEIQWEIKAERWWRYLSRANPLVSSATLKSRMTGRTAVSFFNLKKHVLHGDLKTDWVLGGVIVNKTPTKVSQKGKKYIVWTLSDLKTGLLTAALFLFGRACEKLWKTQLGAVVVVLNPSPLSQNSEKGSSKEKDQAKLSILDSDQVMLLGRSKDLGTCKGKKKDGGDCTAFVNARECEYCNYHVASAYKEYRGRAELQSPSCGTLRSLKNKVLGKNEVFYGGKSFVAEPVRSNAKDKKVLAKDKQRLANLGISGGPSQSPSLPSLSATQLSARATSVMSMLGNVSINKSPKTPQAKDRQRLNSLSARAESAKGCDVNKKTSPSHLTKKPTLSNTDNGVIEFQIPDSDPSAKPAVSTKQLGAPGPARKSEKPAETKLQTQFKNLVNMSSETDKMKKPAPQFESKTGTLVVSGTSGTSATKQHTCTEVAVSKTDDRLADSPSKILLERSPSTINSLPVKGAEAVRTMVQAVTRLPTSRASKAKMKALQIVKKTGGITKENPRGVSREELVCRALKRTLEEEEEEAKEEIKNNVLSSRFIELMKMESRHTDLLKEFDQQQEDAYYEKMERKEQMEEKMMSITKIECKAVRCMKCRYTWFSASDECKAERHPLKVIDALKRFFKCNDCGNRTVSLSILPLLPCKKCSSTSWVKTAMMKEKIVKSNHQLSIRGGEQKFVNSVATDANINLLVPDE